VIDLGCVLQVEVTSLENERGGKAVVTFGPVELDPSIRVTIDNILGSGGSKFPVTLRD